MTRTGLTAIFAMAAALAGAACSNAGKMEHTTGTNVVLSNNNYRVLRAGATGESSGFRLFGIIPIVSPDYATAKENLYRSSGVNFEGRPVALANETEDQSNLYLLLFSIPPLKVTADIVEFTDSAAAPTVRSGSSLMPPTPARQGLY